MDRAQASGLVVDPIPGCFDRRYLPLDDDRGIGPRRADVTAESGEELAPDAVGIGRAISPGWRPPGELMPCVVPVVP